jgi:glycine/D-amino acid oxidase-like deaminating enzyme
VTKDGKFIIDWLPPVAGRGAQRILVLGGFCGSGFKHAPLVGRIAQEMVCAAEVGNAADAARPPCFPDIARFSLARPALYETSRL